MPTYDYVCDACGHKFELFQSMTEPVKRKCPKCGALKLKRLVGIGAGVIFKGSGFYETDYRSESYKKAADAEKSAATPAKEGDSSAKSESKSSDATDSKPAKSETKKASTDKPAKKKSERKK